MPWTWAVSQHVWSDCSSASSRCSGCWFRVPGLYPFLLQGWSKSSSIKDSNSPKTLVSWSGLEQLCAPLLSKESWQRGHAPGCQGVPADAVQLHCSKSGPTPVSPAQDWHSTWARCQQGDGFLPEIWPLSSQGGVQAEQACLILPVPVQISSAAHGYPGCELLLPPGLFPSCMLSRTEGFLNVHLRCQQKKAVTAWTKQSQSSSPCRMWGKNPDVFYSNILNLFRVNIRWRLEGRIGRCPAWEWVFTRKSQGDICSFSWTFAK